MRLLLDAHALLWFLADDPRLSPTARELISDQANNLILGMGTCWEISIKVSLGKLKLTQPFSRFMDSAVAAHQIELLPINLRHISRLSELPFHHRDPFDRLLAAQAQEESLAVVSTDTALDAYGVQRVW